MAINVDYYLNRIRSKVTSVAAQVSSALPGNPVTRDYEVLSQVGSAGPAFSWKIYAAQKRSTKKEYLFRDSYAFCTEPVFASLANAFGYLDNITPCPAHLNEFELLDIEIRYGLFQVVEALSFLHIDVRMMHRNISPESVIINEKGEWKLAGFDFSVQGMKSTNNQVTYEMLEWNQRTMSVVQPLLDYLAPEYVIGGRCDPYADIFSFGIMALTVFNKGKQPFDNRNSLDNFRKNTEKLNTLPLSVFVNVPAELRDDLKMCLNLTPDLRPDATQFSKIVYFDEPLIRTLNSLDSLCQMDYTQKMNFFKQLPQFLEKFPKVIINVISEKFSEISKFIAAELVPFILPNVFYIAEITSNDEFAATVLPQLVPIFTLERPYQILLLFLQNIDLLLQKTSEESARKYLLPLICKALSSETVKIQELCLSIVPKVATMIERQSMKREILPKLLHLIIDGGGVLTIRVQALLCIGKLLPSLEPWMVTEQIIPALPKVISREPAILMAILGIYKLAYEEKRFGITREQCARSILPFLIASSMENTLNMPQFEHYMALIHRILERIEKEQRHRLQQLSATQEEQRNIGEFANVLGEPATQKGTLSDNLEELVIDGSTDGKSNGIDRNTGPLSLAAKKRLAAEREQNLRMRSQPNILQPVSVRKSTNKNEPKSSDFFTPPIDLAVEVVGCSSLIPTTSISTNQTHIDLFDFFPIPSLSEKVKNEATRSSIDNPLWPDPFRMEPNNSLASFMPQPTGNAVILPGPPVVQNPVARKSSGQRITANRTGNASVNVVDRKTNMSAFDDIVCFPDKHNIKNKLPLNSQNIHSKPKKNDK